MLWGHLILSFALSINILVFQSSSSINMSSLSLLSRCLCNRCNELHEQSNLWKPSTTIGMVSSFLPHPFSIDDYMFKKFLKLIILLTNRLEDTLIDLYLSGYNNIAVSAADTVTDPVETNGYNFTLETDGLFLTYVTFLLTKVITEIALKSMCFSMYSLQKCWNGRWLDHRPSRWKWHEW